MCELKGRAACRLDVSGSLCEHGGWQWWRYVVCIELIQIVQPL